MLDKINAIEARYNEINQLIEQSVDDYAKTNELMKERSDIEEIVEKGREYKSALQQLEDAKELTGGQDQEMAELAQMEIEELLCTADICISDYSSLIFEYSLFEKPMIFFAYDLDEYFDYRGFYYDYDEMTPGPIVKDSHELIRTIKEIDAAFDPAEVAAFKEKFMSACDGKATERIIDTICR